MDQNPTVNKVLRDMKQFELISKDITGEVRSGEARVFLNALWIAGWEKGKHDACVKFERKVAQYDVHHSLIEDFSSIRTAAKVTGFSETQIKTSIREKKRTRAGHYWKYLDIKKAENYPGPSD